MIKKTFYQNSKYAQELIQTFESDFVFGEKTVNRIKISKINPVTAHFSHLQGAAHPQIDMK